MSLRPHMISLFLGMAAVTHASRMLPFFALRGRSLPKWARTWLGFVAPAMMASLLVPSILTPTDGRLNLRVLNPYLIASVPTFFVAIRSRNMLATVATGVLSAWLAGSVLLLR